MYVHPSHRFNDQRDILALIESHPLGAWVCPAPQGLLANHVPFLLDRSRGERDYVAANVHGTARAIDDVNELRDFVERLTQRHESVQPSAWKVSDAPSRYIDKMLRAIVGIEIPIDRIEAKLKASQDEAMDDRLGTVQGLQATGSDEAQQMADWVRRAINAQTPDNAA